MIKNKCPDSVRGGPGREFPPTESTDLIFRDILSYYDVENRLHQKQKFMGTRMGQFPFDLQVITEVRTLRHDLDRLLMI